MEMTMDQFKEESETLLERINAINEAALKIIEKIEASTNA